MIDFLIAFKEFKNLKLDLKNEVKLLFIGDGKYVSLLQNKLKELKLEDDVFLLGKSLEIKEILSISSLLALTSYYEGFLLVILEALASSVPCLASDVGEIKYMIGDAGYVVKPGDILQIKQKLIDFYMLDEKEKRSLQDKAFTRVKDKFNRDKIVKKLLEIYLY
jgi:glycosyltransferase involved in cell wall biosynthesis